MKKALVFTVLFVVALAVACGALKAPLTKDGQKVHLYVFLDTGVNPSMPDETLKQRNQLGSWMTADLDKILVKTGYDVTMIASKEEYKPAAGAYLLAVRVNAYNPGSKAARVVGAIFGGYSGHSVAAAGAASLATHYDLFENGPQTVVQNDFVLSSTVDWTDCARDINHRTSRELTEKLVSILGPAK